LPNDPNLAAYATALNEAGHWAVVLDATWRLVFATDEARVSWGDVGVETFVPVGCHYFSEEVWQFFAARGGGSLAQEAFRRATFSKLAGFALAGTPGGPGELRGLVGRDFADLVDALRPQDLPIISLATRSTISFAGTEVGAFNVLLRINDDQGRVAGVCMLLKPEVGMSQLAAAAATADLGHLERMRSVERPDRRPTAILMADLEASSPLARRLSTAQYFAFGRRLVRAADQCIVDAGGIVGRHAGDGVVAFFLAEVADSESAAARSCIAAANALRDTLTDIAARSDMPASKLSLRFGLHFGATLYIGRVLTAGRSEVTALGDEMNETARIESCATDGRMLASKQLMERLDPSDADALRLDLRHLTYTPLAELATASDKARRDAPSIAVCEL
jgi:class 3 adenylate cyclase